MCQNGPAKASGGESTRFTCKGGEHVDVSWPRLLTRLRGPPQVFIEPTPAAGVRYPFQKPPGQGLRKEARSKEPSRTALRVLLPFGSSLLRPPAEKTALPEQLWLSGSGSPPPLFQGGWQHF